MSDVFISYASSSEEQAKQVEQVLRDDGFGVWRDAELPVHRSYAEVIEERLKSAKAVVVLWSADAAKSQWVRAEADAAREFGTLVQGSVDGTTPPIPFNQIQYADLKGWSGDSGHPGWQKLKASVAALAGEKLRPAAAEASPSLKKSLCVLPFANMSGDPEQEYFSDGICEDITTDLSKVSALAVTARNTAFTFKGAAVDVPTIARKVGVSHVLEGSVRKVGNRVRITAQLIDGATGDHIWAERYDRELNDIFAIQDEISKAIVEALKVRLLPKEKASIEQRGTTSAEAYNLYLMARDCWATASHGDIRREQTVERMARRATDIDPQYARAWALMALAQVTLKFGFGKPGDGGIAAAERALALDPKIAEAHAVIARHLLEEGRDREADKAIATALELDPDSWEVNKEAARICMGRRQLKEAVRHYEKAVEVMESDQHAWMMLSSCSQALGDRPRAERAAKMLIMRAERALINDPNDAAALASGVSGLAVLGESERARDWIERALLIDPDNLNMRYNFACSLAAQIGDKEGALKLLERNFAELQGTHFRMAEVDPDLDCLRDDPRFQKMIAETKRRLGLIREHPVPLTPPAAS